MKNNFGLLLCVLGLLIVVIAFINLQLGYVVVPISDFFKSQNTLNNQVIELRFNRLFAMLLAGLAIPTSGFLLQEYFQNPIVGPSVLGITSVASFSVALFLFSSPHWEVSEFLQNSLLSLFAWAGSLVAMLLLWYYSSVFQDKNYLIIFGFLISSLSGAGISLLEFFADSKDLQSYILWSFGSNLQVSRMQIYLLTFLVFLGLIFSSKSIKPLIGNTLGKNYALSFGVDLYRLKLLIIVSTSLLTSAITAYLGPILFVGIIVPHFNRLLWNPNQLWHQWFLNLFSGMLIMLCFSCVSEITQFPINILTSFFGIPVMLMMIIQKSSHGKTN